MKFLKKIGAVCMSMILLTSAAFGMNICNVKAEDTVLTSSEISVVGFQMKTNPTVSQGVTFRALCKAPKIGSTITVDSKDYKVTNLGIIYTKDINTSGDNANNSLDKSYTILNPQPFPSYAIKDGYDFKYIGSKDYLNSRVTFGYVASETGIVETVDGYTTYVRTMTNMDAYIRNSIFVRGFVEAIDENGDTVIIYGTYASVASVAQMAHMVYNGSKAPNKEGHDYIFNSILNKLPTYSPYYLENPLEYGWSVVVPS